MKYIILAVMCILLYIVSRDTEQFVDIKDAFSKDAMDDIQKKYDTYNLVKEFPNALMKGKPAGGYKPIPPVEKKDCSSCKWKMDNNCVSMKDGKIVYDERCNEQDYIDPFGNRHRSKGFMCSAWGTDLGFEECNPMKCKNGSMTGCNIADLPNKIQNIATLTSEDVSGQLS